jgi:putative N6-adenine-specific DNA methylase
MSHVTALPAALDAFAVATPGVEMLVASELAELAHAGAGRVEPGDEEPGGVAFRADLEGLYAANLYLRIASRILVRIGSFRATSFRELERYADRIPWATVLGPSSTVRFRVTSKKSRLYHQDAVAQRLLASAAKAVVDVREGASEEPDVQEIVVRIFRDQCTVSADASGELLHRRGYRQQTAKAPLRETLAAAMLRASGWNDDAPLLDPMCGAGTIPIEAAMVARRIPPGLDRRFAFMRWPEFDSERWERLVEHARARIRPAAPASILGSDRDAGAVAAAAANAERAGVAENIEWRRSAISAISPPPGPGWIVSNPPYGVRVGERRALRDLYAQLGHVARRCCPGWQVALLTAHAELERQTGLDLSVRFTTDNGGIRVRMMQGGVASAG